MTKKIEFQPPAGAVPEGLSAGDEFDLVSTFRIKPNGTICLVQMGDTKMPGYSEDTSKPDNYAGEYNTMQGMMGEQS